MPFSVGPSRLRVPHPCVLCEAGNLELITLGLKTKKIGRNSVQPVTSVKIARHEVPTSPLFENRREAAFSK